MKLRVLGCSGGIGQDLRTSSFLIDQDILLDAGTGVGDLSLEEMRQIRHVFLTHSHMDHICTIPLLVDTLFSELEQPLKVHGRPETIQALQTHVFNWSIWPDFTELPAKECPVLEFIPMQPGEFVDIGDRRLEMVAVNHTVPASAYIVCQGNRAMAYSGDTTTNDSLWQRLNQLDSLGLLIVESAFANHDRQLAELACHYCPELLQADLAKLKHQPRIGITHLKPGEERLIMDEIYQALGNTRDIHQLAGGDQFQI